MKPLAPFLFLALLGCPRQPVQAPPSASAEDVLDAMREAAPTAPFQARFSVSVKTPETSITTAGNLVIGPPDHLRLEILTPLRTPAFLAVSDGQRIDAYSTRGRTFYSGDDAVAVLTELTGGAVGMNDLIGLLTPK